MMIGCFCAASNITGVLNDDINITAILHNYGALSFWDYATAAPYVDINVNPKVPNDVENLCAKDAVYFSMHKFVGGVQTPGVLVAKKELFKNSPMYGGGGGSVFFVTESDHKYLKETELREEGGTPAIVESIRAGLVMKLKKSVKAEEIIQREHALLDRAKHRLAPVDNFVLLGNAFQDSKQYLPVLSFFIKSPKEFENSQLHVKATPLVLLVIRTIGTPPAKIDSIIENRFDRMVTDNADALGSFDGGLPNGARLEIQSQLRRLLRELRKAES